MVLISEAFFCEQQSLQLKKKLGVHYRP